MDVNFILGGDCTTIFKIEVGFFDTVVEMKQMLEGRCGIPAQKLIFLFDGHFMDDDHDVQFYGLYECCDINVIIDIDGEGSWYPQKRRKTIDVAVAGLIESWLNEPSEEGCESEEQTILPSLPIDVIAEIISRLPVKTLLRLRSVCKSWRELIDSNGFALRLHLPRSRAPLCNRILIGHDKNFFHISPEAGTDHLEEIHIPFPKLKRGHIHSAGSRNGLICIYQSPDSKRVSFYVLNPATRKYVCLPGVCDRSECIVHFCQILWDPLGGTGVGVHKVLVILWRKGLSLTIILTVGVDETWRVLNNPFLYWNSEKMMECPCINGAVHCVCFDDKRRQSARMCFIAAFDITDERFRNIKIPNACCIRRQCYPTELDLYGHHLVEVVELKGMLSLLHINGPKTILENWLLTDYSRGVWTKHHTVNLEFIYREPIGGKPPFFDFRTMNVVSKASDGKILIKIGNIRDGRRYKDRWEAIFLSYDPQLTNGNSTKLLGLARCGTSDYKRYAEDGLACMGSPSWRGGYVESLVSLDAITSGCKKRMSKQKYSAIFPASLN